jgi:hypothetical protein
MGHTAVLAKVISYNSRFLKTLPALPAARNYGELLTSDRAVQCLSGTQITGAKPY